ncbi:hypothetical protein [Spiribacter vilamensis]|uniref:Uncharacterized protein n=1 Tax=Spiribacter vilamensis TaxID=531306 RepID=A0A4Q8D0E7_9GAMM|nr:hypothetical protein [Spiribacter vilamensis]RZU98744.1 hypothetical protein EV698_1005 [Spiribacter vilamensis]TVO62233.1 hypothetical protein FPL09_09190 [Spiribacter vilamensis]
MSQYERLRAEGLNLRRQQAFVLAGPTALMVAAAYGLADSASDRLLYVALALPFALVIAHGVFLVVSRRYRAACQRSSVVRTELARLEQALAARFDAFRMRRKGESFKKAYGLAGRGVTSLEEALAVGMYRERREVFVTAFMRSGVVVRVTASIGSLYRCRPADDPAKWRDHIVRLGCDEIRQYHNHPVHNGDTAPSAGDVRSGKQLGKLLGPHAPMLQSFVIYWNQPGEWRIIEYDAKGNYWSHFRFDIGRSMGIGSDGSGRRAG